MPPGPLASLDSTLAAHSRRLLCKGSSVDTVPERSKATRPRLCVARISGLNRQRSDRLS